MSAVPAFVFRGLGAMQSHTDFTSVRYRTEADLRDALAAVWWMKGVDVRTEVDVPGCGRIDVLGKVKNVNLIVELKREITTPSAARKAFMQAHSYKAFLEAQRPTDYRFALATWDERIWDVAYVTAGDGQSAAIEPSALAFRDVEFVDFVTAERLPEECFQLLSHHAFMRDISVGRQAMVRRVLDALRVGETAITTADENYRLRSVS